MNPHLNRALLLIQQNRHELAEPELRQVLATDPQLSYAHALLALCLNERKAWPDATAEVQQAIHLGPDEPYPHYVHARILYDRNHHDAALVAVRESIRLDPSDADYCSLEAGILFDEKRWQESLEAAERGLELDAEHVGCTNLRAMALVKLGRRSEAGATIDAALAKNPESAITHANQGWTLLEAGKPKQALHHFQEALRLDPENEWARHGVIEALKARNFIYALALKYFFFMSRLTPGMQWGIILGGYFGSRLLGGAAKANPALVPWVLPLQILYLLFVFLTWTADALFNLMLRLNKFGRLALTEEKRIASNWVGACVGLAVLSFAAALVTDWNTLPVLGTGVCFGLIIPLAATFKCQPGWPRKAMAGYTGLMALMGLSALVLVALGISKDNFSAVFGCFLIGLIGSPWVANILISQRPKY